MIIFLKFDYQTSVVYVPDGYVMDAKTLRSKFLAWVYENPNCIAEAKDHQAFTFDEKDFVTFMNETILSGVNERAYVCSYPKAHNEKTLTIKL